MPSRFRIFLSSPSDLVDERRQCAEIVQELNTMLRALVPDRSVELELVQWETHTFPDMGLGAQQVVDGQVDSDYDIYVGMMWSRFGTPTGTSGSGTEHEFRAALAGRRERRRPAYVLFYFCDAPIPASEARRSAGQLAKIDAFQQELQQLGLIRTYDSHGQFGVLLRRDLVLVVSKLLHANQSASSVAQEIASHAPAGELDIVRRQLTELAHEYEQVRATMKPGDERTRRMGNVVSRMRSLAQSAYGLLSELVVGSPGHRLAAVAVLQAIPDARYLTWLADRVRDEKPFGSYHASQALLVAARELPFGELEPVSDALNHIVRSGVSNPDSLKTVRHALDEVEWRLAQDGPGGNRNQPTGR